MRKKTISKLISSILIMIMAVCSIIVIYATVSENNKSVLGYRLFIIKTGSMHGTLEIGDLIVTKKTSKERLQIGSVISFVSSDPDIFGEVNTHRIVDIKGDSYYTKGDATDFIDQASINYADILGELAWKSAFAGKALMWLAKPMHMFLFVILPTAFMMYLEIGNGAQKIRRLFFKNKKNPNYGDEQKILNLLLQQKSGSILPAGLQALIKENSSTSQTISNEALPGAVLAMLSKEVYLEKLTNQFIGKSGETGGVLFKEKKK